MRLAAAAFVVSAVLVTAVASFFAFSPEHSGTIAFWLLAGGPSVVLAGAAAALAQREDLLRDWITPRWGDVTRGILGAVVFFAAALAFARTICPTGSPHEIWLVTLYGQIGDPRKLERNGALLGFTVAVVAAAEEMVWRGMVTQILADRVGSRSAWVWAAVLYAVALIPTVWALRSPSSLDPILALAALAGGLLWGFMTRVFRSLVPAILAHALFDWLVLVVFPLWGSRVWV